MPRIYSNYTEAEFELIKTESEKLGLTLSAYQKYRTLLSLTKNNSTPITDLIKKMRINLSSKHSGDVFIISTLLPDEWVSLDRSKKNTLSKQLKKIIDQNPDKYEIISTIGNINHYKIK